MDDETQSDNFISAHDFNIVRSAFRRSVAEGLILEQHWVQHVKDLIRELTDHETPDETLIDRIIQQ